MVTIRQPFKGVPTRESPKSSVRFDWIVVLRNEESGGYFDRMDFYHCF